MAVSQVGNLTSNSSVADLINKYTHMDKGDIHHHTTDYLNK